MILKKIIPVIFLILVLSALGVWALLNSSHFSEKFLPIVLNRAVGGTSISDLKIRNQTFHPSGVLTYSNVSFNFKTEKGIYPVSLNSIRFKFHRLFSGKQARIDTTINGLIVKSEIFIFNDCALSFSISKNGSIDNGVFTVGKFDYLGYKMTNLAGVFHSEGSTLLIDMPKGDFYNGTIASGISMENGLQSNYAVTINFFDVDVTQLEQANQALFSNAKGIFGGEIQITGSPKSGYDLEGHVQSFSNAQIKASLIKPLLDYIPQSRQKADLNILIKQQGSIPLETAEIILLNVTDQTLKTKINLKSKKFNLDIGINFDFNIEGGVQNFFNLQKQYFIKSG